MYIYIYISLRHRNTKRISRHLFYTLCLFFAYYYHRPTVPKFYEEHDNGIAVLLLAKFRNDWPNGINVMDERDFEKFVLDISHGGMCYLYFILLVLTQTPDPVIWRVKPGQYHETWPIPNVATLMGSAQYNHPQYGENILKCACC